MEGQQGQGPGICRDHQVKCHAASIYLHNNSFLQHYTKFKVAVQVSQCLMTAVYCIIFVTFRKQVLSTKAEAERDGVKVPTTLAEYCVRTRAPAPDEGSDLFYDYYYDDDDMEGGDGDCCYDEDDSGNEESWPPFITLNLADIC